MNCQQHKKSLELYQKTLEDVAKILFSTPFATSSENAYKQTRELFEELIVNAWTAANRMYSADTPYMDWSHDFIGAPGLLNPDNRYQYAFLRPQGAYEIKIIRGSHCQLTLQTLLGNPAVSFPTSGLDIDLTSMKTGEQCTLYIGGEPRETNWHPLPEGAFAFLVRQTFTDWEGESPSTLSIHSLAPLLGCTRQGDRLAFAAEVLAASTQLFAVQFAGTIDKLPPNVILPPRSSGDQGLAGQYSILAGFNLADDEALLITSKKSTAAYQSIALGNAWGVTADFTLHQSSLSSAQTRFDADGYARYVLSKHDPEVPNWLDTAGNERGMIFMRWQGIEQTPEPSSGVVVKLTELRQKLPADTPRCGSQEREAQLQKRRIPPCIL